MLELNLEELAGYNGRDGKPVYVAYKGKIYDVSGSRLWKTGTHMNRHHSGTDLTADIEAAPHEAEVLERFPQVGVLRPKKTAPEEPKGFLEPVFVRYPILRRHPHPMTVHFPIVFMLSTSFFALLFLLTGNASFETTSFYCLAAGTLFTPLVMVTGFITWLANYMGKPSRRVQIKMICSFIMLVASVVLLAWRVTVPDLLTTLHLSGIIYLLLIFSLSPIVVVIGWHGAMLTFPMEEH